MSLSDFLQRLDGVRPSGKGYVSKCPAHDDRHQSLSIAEGDNRGIVVKCFAGCTAEQIASAVGLRLSDLMPETRERKPAQRIVATYPYRGADGALLFEVVRYEPKTFRQRRPDGKSGWKWGRGDAPVMPYRLPELLAADASETVFICEGEKDVESLTTLGSVATTTPGGAEGWNADCSRFFSDRRVVVLPDNDEPGRKYALAVALSLHGKAKSLRVVALPNLLEKGDVSDFLSAGGTLQDLNRIIQETSEWEPPKSPGIGHLLDELVAFVRRYVVLTAAQARVTALWIAHTHAVEAAEATPYLAITSAEKRSGKTRLLEVLNLLVARAWFTGRVTAAVLVRKIDAIQPTLLLDESDAAFGGEKEYAEALRGILNTGHRRGGVASCCVGKGSETDYRDFQTFCPKAIAGIGRLPDTVADRAVPIRLQRKTGSEQTERFRMRDVEPFGTAIRSQLEAWALGTLEALRGVPSVVLAELSDRAADGAEPLLAIAALAGEKWLDLARDAFVELCGSPEVEAESTGIRLLSDCRILLEDADRISSADLCERLGKLEEAPWGEFQKGRAITPRQLATLLSKYDIKSRSVRFDDVTTAKGYLRGHFQDAWSRYLTPSSTRSEVGKVTTSQVNADAILLDITKRHDRLHVTDGKLDFGNTDRACDQVTFGEPEGYPATRPNETEADEEAAIL